MVDNAVQAARKAIESRYTGRCDIYEEKPTRNQQTKVTQKVWARVNTGPVPCRLSFSTGSAAIKTGGAFMAEQKIKVFLPPEVVVKPGSLLEITQNGIAERYKNSGIPAVYVTHQEILLEKEGEWT